MAQIKPFKQYLIQESDSNEDKLARLRRLGLEDAEPFEQRYQKALDEWGSDPDINAAIDMLTKKTGLIIDKWIDLADDEDVSEWEQMREWLYSDTSVDDMGFFEFMVANGLTD